MGSTFPSTMMIEQETQRGRACGPVPSCIYKPNISLIMRSEPRTRPVRISILNTIWPTYCQTMVAASRVASVAGVLLERNAE